MWADGDSAGSGGDTFEVSHPGCGAQGAARRGCAAGTCRRGGDRTAAEPPQPAEPISGAVFGLPTIGYGGDGAARWMRARAESPATPAAPLALPPQALAQTVQDAGRAQIALARQQTLAALPPPAEGGEGRCALHDDRDTPLACDSEPLQRALQADAAGLAGLLQAYRGMDPRIADIALAFTRGLYRLEQR